MARTSKMEKLVKLEEQEIEIKNKRKRLKKELTYEIGKTLLEEWEINEEQAIELIKQVKPHVEEILNNNTGKTVATNEK